VVAAGAAVASAWQSVCVCVWSSAVSATIPSTTNTIYAALFPLSYLCQLLEEACALPCSACATRHKNLWLELGALATADQEENEENDEDDEE
jgi:hypothetical protein